MNSRMSETYRRYVETLENKLEELYVISEEAREKGYDPTLEPECKVAKDLADLVEGLVGPKGVAESIRELSKKIPREELAFKIAEEIVYGKFGHLEPEAVAEQAIRTALAILTEGLTAAPLQGVAEAKIKTNHDRTHYLAIYFAGPIRSAGGTDQALTLVIGDFVRRLIGLDRYKPTEEEISRFVEEMRLYERSVSRFQYHVSDEELRKALEWLPVEVTGTESDPVEVSSFRNLPRVETNRVRGGALRVVNDGVVGRAPKVLTIIEKLGFQGWDWLKEFRRKSEKKSAGFMDDVIAGRPIFSFPSKRGGFRLRYGRARNTGLAAVGVHPATMLVLQGFLAAGTQLRLELPGKGGIAVPVDSLEPPIVRLKDSSVVRVSVENFHGMKNNIEKILFLGDILISFGDFLYNSKLLEPSGYVEEWWAEDLRKAIVEKFKGHLESASETIEVPLERLKVFLEDPFMSKPCVKEAIILSLTLDIPLHPSFTFFWPNLSSLEQLKQLREWLLNSEIYHEKDAVCKIIGKMEVEIKHSLETICLPHKISNEKVIIEGEEAHTFAFCLGYRKPPNLDFSSTSSILEAISLLSNMQIRKKAPTLVGSRMGRPEKAKRREMKPLVHVLFPVSLAGGAKRDIVEAAKREPVFVDIVKRKCSACKTFTFRAKCPICGSETVFEKSCPRCGKSLKGDECPICKVSAVTYKRQVVNFKELLESTCSNLGVSVPRLLKGVKGLTNETRNPEVLEKGVLRAKYDLSVYKDGTIRFDATNAPLTHFKPSEIGVAVETLRKLGYTHDVQSMPLENVYQMCELRLQDVVIPIKCAEYFAQVANFIDDLLMKVYGLSPFYNIERAEDLVGHLVVGLAPHTSVGILGRIVGFTNLNICYAHPVWQSAKRRDCDGDEDSLMLALDTLLNFSREYLPTQIGGIMDAPLLLIPIVNTEEVQRQAHDVDVADAYPVEFYEKTLETVESKQVSPLIDIIEYRLGTEAQFEGFKFTTPVSNINMGNDESSYKRLRTMIEKLDSQLELAEKIEAVEAKTVALKVLTTHFIRDIVGNLRAFSTQGFRCKSCNKRFRRLPLRGKCLSCGGQLSLTVYRGGIEKYLEAAQRLVEQYELPQYYAQRISLMKDEINALFANKKPKQISLTAFA
ncbi:MAG: DNA polymerase II large subunit [Candidatus Bathyarchaeota archaeon]|nr:DNA polymerase II large subunit [Candidatus Bathyarchaeota archaeon]MDH5787674.1 DNA polymerase II large subunit [Candidatus Bathyarchaeota archaeon]